MCVWIGVVRDEVDMTTCRCFRDEMFKFEIKDEHITGKPLEVVAVNWWPGRTSSWLVDFPGGYDYGSEMLYLCAVGKFKLRRRLVSNCAGWALLAHEMGVTVPGESGAALAKT
jgi:hypothetical protein